MNKENTKPKNRLFGHQSKGIISGMGGKGKMLLLVAFTSRKNIGVATF